MHIIYLIIIIFFGRSMIQTYSSKKILRPTKILLFVGLSNINIIDFPNIL